MNYHDLLSESRQRIPGGVNSPVRSFNAVGAEPLFAVSGKGCRLTDTSGNSYIDYVCSYGPLIFGHADDEITKVIQSAAADGASFGFSTPYEVELAELIAACYGAAEMTRLVSSGTEAAMSALRVARAYTGRNKIVKFDGCYHGHADGLLAAAGSGALSHAVPSGSGVPKNHIHDTLVSPYNDIGAVTDLFVSYGQEIAAVIVEPVAGNMGVIAPKPGFLEALRSLCSRYHTVLIFDEVITGFRLGLSGAAGLYGVEPDLACFGKILGGGLPIGAYAGKKELMQMVSPVGPVYQAGTLSGNPIAVRTGLAVLKRLAAHPEVYGHLRKKAAWLEKEINSAARGAACVSRVESLITVFFTETVPSSKDEITKESTEAFKSFFQWLYKNGVLIAPSQYEAWFLSTSHDKESIAYTADVIRQYFMREA